MVVNILNLVLINVTIKYMVQQKKIRQLLKRSQLLKKVSNTTTDTKKDTTTKDSENEGVTYLNNLKTNYQFIEPTKLASGYIDIGGSVGKVRCYTDAELAVQGVSAEDVYNSKKISTWWNLC